MKSSIVSVLPLRPIFKHKLH